MKDFMEFAIFFFIYMHYKVLVAKFLIVCDKVAKLKTYLQTKYFTTLNFSARHNTSQARHQRVTKFYKANS